MDIQLTGIILLIHTKCLSNTHSPRCQDLAFSASQLFGLSLLTLQGHQALVPTPVADPMAVRQPDHKTLG